VDVISAPVDVLREIHIVDTPGTNAILREHERLTAEFVPRSDLVLFVTSADRPFTETERGFLQLIRDWGKKIVIGVTRADIRELDRGFELRMAAVEKVLIEMESRGHRYFEDTMRIGRVMDLVNRTRVQKEFEERVVANAPRDIERRVAELIDWLIDQDFREWQ